MSNALAKIAETTGVSTEEINNVLSGMIISAKNQRGAVASPAELAVVAGVCSKYGLNPLVKECAAFISDGKLQVIVMIDGYYAIVNRQPNFDGVEFDDHLDDKGKITAITCKMYIKNRSRPVCVTEYLSECFNPKSSVWKKWPARMIRHKAYIQAARMAFGFSELLDTDEVDRIKSNSPKDVTPTVEVDFERMQMRMAQCWDIDSLNALCKEIRLELEKQNAWASSKTRCSLLKLAQIKNIDGMNTRNDDVVDAEFEVVEDTGEITNKPTDKADEPDIPFDEHNAVIDVEFEEVVDK